MLKKKEPNVRTKGLCFEDHQSTLSHVLHIEKSTVTVEPTHTVSFSL